jgi:hypothetical protein
MKPPGETSSPIGCPFTFTTTGVTVGSVLGSTLINRPFNPAGPIIPRGTFNVPAPCKGYTPTLSAEK